MVGGVHHLLAQAGILKMPGRFHHHCADLVVLALPAPQAGNLLSGTGSPLEGAGHRVEMAPTWAGMIAFERPLDLPLDSARISGGPLAWVARNNSKSGRPRDPDTWVLHASTPWSEAHLEDPPEAVVEALLATFMEVAGREAPPVLYSTAHLWRHARSILPDIDGAWLDDARGLGVCGDWLLGDDLESAFLSGRAMAGQLLSSSRFQSATRSA